MWGVASGAWIFTQYVVTHPPRFCLWNCGSSSVRAQGNLLCGGRGPACAGLSLISPNRLPHGGDFPYVPPRQKGNPTYVRYPGAKRSFIDRNGNKWTWDKSRHGGDHWDVELKGTQKHKNVDEKGKIRGE